MHVRFARPDGKDCPAYLATPARGDSGPAIVVIQEWWGLNDQIQKTADRLAAEGFRALVPDLFRGKLPKSAEDANHVMNELNFVDAAEQDIRGAVRHLKQASSKVGVMGFCMGGALTILSAVKVPEMDAGACFYGIPPASVADPATIAIPMQYHFGNRDEWWSRDAVNALENAVKGSKNTHALYRYEAQHAFMNEARPEVYDAACATLAWGRAVEFLRTALG